MTDTLFKRLISVPLLLIVHGKSKTVKPVGSSPILIIQHFFKSFLYKVLNTEFEVWVSWSCLGKHIWPHIQCHGLTFNTRVDYDKCISVHMHTYTHLPSWRSSMHSNVISNWNAVWNIAGFSLTTTLLILTFAMVARFFVICGISVGSLAFNLQYILATLLQQ